VAWLAYIYCLANPETGQVRYVGKTNDPKKRIAAHLSNKAERARPKVCWIDSLIKKGLTPSMEVIEVVECESDADWQDAERFWIAYFKFLGFRLLNLDGGGLSGKKLSEETKIKISLNHGGLGTIRGHKVSAKRYIDRKLIAKGLPPSCERWSEGHLKKMSEKRKLRKEKPESNQKRSAALSGKSKTPEHAKNISEGQKKLNAQRRYLLEFSLV
jgi:GIY-YIG catalytic domain